MEESINIMDLSEENLNFMTEEYLVIFERLKKVLIEKKNEAINIIGEEPKIDDFKIRPTGKVFTVLKKIAKNAVIAGLTGISPIFLDHDISELKDNSFEHYLQWDLKALAFSVINDAIDGTEEIISRLRSNEKRNQMLINIDKLYNEYRNMEYGSGKRKDYTFLIAEILGFYSDIYDTSKTNKIGALLERGIHLGMGYDFLCDIKDVYSKIHPETKDCFVNHDHETKTQEDIPSGPMFAETEEEREARINSILTKRKKGGVLQEDLFLEDIASLKSVKKIIEVWEIYEFDEQYPAISKTLYDYRAKEKQSWGILPQPVIDNIKTELSNLFEVKEE